MKKIHEQLRWDAEVINGEIIGEWRRVVVGGMGGSQLASGLVQYLAPHIQLRTHRNFSLPLLPKEEAEETLFIASSYSGETAETLSFAQDALEKGYNLAVISSGGKLIDFAKENNLPHVLVPSGLPQRLALGYSLIAFLTLLAQDELLTDLSRAAKKVEQALIDSVADQYARNLADGIVLVWTSSSQASLAYVWKIALNESAKMLSFWNAFPELLHNEIEGFSNEFLDDAYKGLFQVLYIPPFEGDAQTQQARDITEGLLEERGVVFFELNVPGEDKFQKMIYTLCLAFETAELLAEMRKIDPNKVPVIESLKRKLALHSSD